MNNGKRRGINNWETFIALNYTMVDVRVISDEELESIPLGRDIPNELLAEDKKELMDVDSR